MKRCLKCCLSKENIDLWLDLRVDNNGSTHKYKEPFDIIGEVIEEISGSHHYRYTCKNYFSADDADLVSVSALHGKTSDRIKLKNKYPRIEYEISSKQLPQIFMCPQYESRAVLKH